MGTIRLARRLSLPFFTCGVLVLAISGCGDEDTGTGPIDAAPPAVVLAAPSGITSSSADLTWTRSTVTDFAAYRVYAAPAAALAESIAADPDAFMVASVAVASDTTLTVTGLSDTTAYYFAVAVFDDGGQFAVSNVVSTTTILERHYVIASNADGGSVSVFLVPGDSLVVDLTLPAALRGGGGEPRNLAVSPGGDAIYVPFRFADCVLAIDTGTWNTQVIADTSFDEPYAVTFTPDGTEAWVANKKGGGSSVGTVSIIDTFGRSVVAVVDDPALSSPEGIAANDTHAFVINRGNGTVAKIALGSRAVVDTATVGGEPRYGVVSPGGEYLYVSRTANGVSRLDTSTLAETDSYPAAGTPRNMDISADGGRLYVALQSDEIVSIDTASGDMNPIPFTGGSSTYGVAIIDAIHRGYVTDESNEVIHVFGLDLEAEIPGETINATELVTPRAVAGF